MTRCPSNRRLGCRQAQRGNDFLQAVERDLRGTNAGDTLILDFLPQSCKGLPLLSRAVCGSLLQQPYKMIQAPPQRLGLAGRKQIHHAGLISPVWFIHNLRFGFCPEGFVHDHWICSALDLPISLWWKIFLLLKGVWRGTKNGALCLEFAWYT